MQISAVYCWGLFLFIGSSKNLLHLPMKCMRFSYVPVKCQNCFPLNPGFFSEIMVGSEIGDKIPGLRIVYKILLQKDID